MNKRCKKCANRPAFPSCDRPGDTCDNFTAEEIKVIKEEFKIKKCCKDYKFVTFGNVADDGKPENIKPSIWHIPAGCWEEEGISVEIKYCPFCGKKIEVEA